MLVAVLVLLLMVTSTGVRRCFGAMRRIGAGMVAENSATWRCGGVCSRMLSTASTKPMRSISSASSSTSSVMPESFKVPRFM